MADLQDPSSPLDASSKDSPSQGSGDGAGNASDTNPFFFTDPEGDFIFRTSDGKEIRALRAILSRASEFFRSMFDIPQPPIPSPSSSFGDGESESETDSAVTTPMTTPRTTASKVPGTLVGTWQNSVDIVETSTIFSILLRLTYPLPAPNIPEPLTRNILVLLRVAEKYSLLPAITFLKARLVQKDLVERDPVRVYAIARQFGYKDEARLAAQMTLRIGLIHTDSLQGEEYDGFLARDYIRLVNWHKSSSTRATSVLSNFRLTSATACTTCQAWGCCWWPAFRTRALEAVQLRPYDPSIFQTDFLVQAIMNGDCENRWMAAFSANTRLVLSAIRTKIWHGNNVDVFGEKREDY